VDAMAGQVSLLEIVRGMQHKEVTEVHVKRRPLAAVASEVQTQHHDLEGHNAHERMLLSDMGHLEDQLERWKESTKDIQYQMAQQTATVDSLKAEQARAIHDEQVAAMVWWDCKMLMCLLVASGLGFCIYSTTSQSCLKTSSLNAAEPAQPTARKVRAQPEFVEKDAKPEAEDSLQVILSLPRPAAPAERQDLEAATARPQAEETNQHEQDETSMDSRRSECQFFSLKEDPATLTVCASPEDAWWGESASGY